MELHVVSGKRFLLILFNSFSLNLSIFSFCYFFILWCLIIFLHEYLDLLLDIICCVAIVSSHSNITFTWRFSSAYHSGVSYLLCMLFLLRCTFSNTKLILFNSIIIYFNIYGIPNVCLFFLFSSLQ